MDITLWQLISAYIFMVLLLVIVRWRRIPREKEIVIATFRMTIQLVLVGYVLVFIFENENWIYSILVLMLMEIFAVYNIYRRTKMPLTKKSEEDYCDCYDCWYTLLVFIF